MVGIAVDASCRWPTSSAKRRDKHVGSVSRVEWKSETSEKLLSVPTVPHTGPKDVVTWNDLLAGGDRMLQEIHVTPEFKNEIVVSALMPASPQFSLQWAPKRSIASCQIAEVTFSGSAPQQGVSGTPEAFRVPPSTLGPLGVENVGSPCDLDVVTGWEECVSKTPISTIAWLGGEDVVTQTDLDVGEESTLEKIQEGTSVESRDEQCEISNVARIFRRPTRRAKKKKKTHGAAVPDGEESQHSLKWGPKWPTTSWHTADAPVSGSTPQDVSGTPVAVGSPPGRETEHIGSVSRREKDNGKGLQSASTAAWLSGDDVICSNPDVGEESTLEEIPGGDSWEVHDEQTEGTHFAQVYRRPTRRAKKKKKYVDAWSEWVRCKGKIFGPDLTTAQAGGEDVDDLRPPLRQPSRPAKAAMQDSAAPESQTVQNPQESHNSQDVGAERWVMIQTHGGGKQWRRTQGLDGLVSDVVTWTDLDVVEVEYDLSIEGGQKGPDAVKESALQKIPEMASTEYDDDEEEEEVLYCARLKARRPIRRAKRKNKHEKIAKAMSRCAECQRNKDDENKEVAKPGDENEVAESDVDIKEETILKQKTGVVMFPGGLRLREPHLFCI